MYSTAAPPPLRLFSPPLRHRLLVKPNLLLRLLSPPSGSPSLQPLQWKPRWRREKRLRDPEPGCKARTRAESTYSVFFLYFSPQLGGLLTSAVVTSFSVHIAWISSSDLQDGKQQRLLFSTSADWWTHQWTGLCFNVSNIAQFWQVLARSERSALSERSKKRRAVARRKRFSHPLLAPCRALCAIPQGWQ